MENIVNMAALIARSLLKSSNRNVLVSSSRLFATKREIPDGFEHATGLEKRELIARAAGNNDPFQLGAFKRGPGTKDNPNLVPSMLEKRIIGCICHEDATAINYMWLHKGDPKRCECGYWFKLVDGKFI